MKLTRLLIAAVVMAGLGGVVWWSNKQQKAKESQPSAGVAPKILSLKESDITGIEIDKGTGETAERTVLKKDSAGKWQITAPQPLGADASAVSSITSLASALTSERMVDANATNLASYGLDPATVTLKLTMKDGKTHTLLVGDDTPTGVSSYVMLAGDPRLFIMTKGSKETFDKTFKDLRDKRLLTFDREKISRVDLDEAGQPPIEFGRVGQDEWQFLKPKVMRADSTEVDDLLSRLSQAQMDPSLSEADAKKYEAAFASGGNLAEVKVTDPNGTQTLMVHKKRAANGVDDFYAKSSVVAGVTAKISTDLSDLLSKKAEDYRNKKLFDFGFDEPSRIDIKDGAKAVTYQKSGDNWTSGGKNMDAVSVEALIDKLRDLSATKFADSGYTKPVMEITVVSNQGKRTETAQIAPAGTDFLAKRSGGDTTLYQLPAATIQDLRKIAGDVKPEQKQKKK
jgi:Domain of unknown function (DUF4340)